MTSLAFVLLDFVWTLSSSFKLRSRKTQYFSHGDCEYQVNETQSVSECDSVR